MGRFYEFTTTELSAFTDIRAVCSGVIFPIYGCTNYRSILSIMSIPCPRFTGHCKTTNPTQEETDPATPEYTPETKIPEDTTPTLREIRTTYTTSKSLGKTCEIVRTRTLPWSRISKASFHSVSLSPPSRESFGALRLAGAGCGSFRRRRKLISHPAPQEP